MGERTLLGTHKYKVVIRVAGEDTVYEFECENSLAAREQAWVYWMHDHSKVEEVQSD